jgi:hypothetical protein
MLQSTMSLPLRLSVRLADVCNLVEFAWVWENAGGFM